MQFSISKVSHAARVGCLETKHGTLYTPAFMPVGTRGAVKTLTSKQLRDLDIQIFLANSYHLMLRPGVDIIAKAGGLHAFTGWQGPIVSDSGGYQIFSQPDLVKVTDEGVLFQSYVDGSRQFLGPQESMELQKSLGADIAICLDHYGMDVQAIRHTLLWAEASKACTLAPHQSLFAVVQGGMRTAEELVAMDFEGYAIGGLMGQNSKIDAFTQLEELDRVLPKEKPRYLMGVGSPKDIVEAVMRGVDLFDCVIPTRNGRRGLAYTWHGKVKVKSATCAYDFSPLDPESTNDASHHTKAYIHHLLKVNEVTGQTLMTIQNLSFYTTLMKKIRDSIETDTLPALYERICALYT